MLTIGNLVKETGVAAQTIRHYEITGLLPPSLRSSGNQRRYGPRHLESLGFIRHARELGFSIEDIRGLMTLERRAGLTDCAEAVAVVDRHLNVVRKKITSLKRLEKELARMRNSCPHPTLGDCQIMATLHDYKHDHCLSAAHDPKLLQERPRRPQALGVNRESS